MAITDWPADQRPREKLMLKGAEALSDAELLAIFLRVGVVGKSAVDLARDLLVHFGSLNAIFSANAKEIATVYGMGSSKYCQLQAIFEMSRRALAEELKQKDALKSPKQVRDYLSLKLGNAPREIFMVLFLDAQNRIQAQENLFEGTLTQASVYPREVVKRALFRNAASVIFAHNHPNGIAEASQADKQLTQVLKSALNLLDIRVLDHFVVAGNDTISFAEQGLL